MGPALFKACAALALLCAAVVVPSGVASAGTTSDGDVTISAKTIVVGKGRCARVTYRLVNHRADEPAFSAYLRVEHVASGRLKVGRYWYGDRFSSTLRFCDGSDRRGLYVYSVEYGYNPHRNPIDGYLQTQFRFKRP